MESDVAFSRCESDELAVQWDLVAPEDVTSIRMALDMGLTLQRAPAEPPPSPPQEGEMPAGTVVSLGPVDDDDDDLSDEEQEEEEEGGEGQKESSEQPLDLEERPTGSVGSLLEADEWVISAVLKRRRAATFKAKPLEDLDADDDDHAWEYLVEWGGHGSYAGTASWERRGDLVDRGFLPLLNDFDTTHAATQASTSTKKKRPAKPPSSEQARAKKAQARLQRRLLAKQRWALGVLDAACVKDPDGLSFHRLFPGFDGNLDTVPALVAQLFAHYPPIAYSVVGECQTRAAFLARLALNPTLLTSVLFHGTRAPAVVPIATLGLRVPGECGVRVANGSACGVGIYTALHPSTSMGYLDGARIMFVCLGLRDIEGRVPRVDPNQALMVQNPAVHVYFHSDLVIPVLAVKLSNLHSGQVRHPHPPPVLCDIGSLAAVKEAQAPA